jgi:hypothetical protein
MRKIRTSLKPASFNNEHNVVIEKNLMLPPSPRRAKMRVPFPGHGERNSHGARECWRTAS